MRFLRHFSISAASDDCAFHVFHSHFLLSPLAQLFVLRCRLARHLSCIFMRVQQPRHPNACRQQVLVNRGQSAVLDSRRQVAGAQGSACLARSASQDTDSDAASCRRPARAPRMPVVFKNFRKRGRGRACMSDNDEEAEAGSTGAPIELG